MNSIETWKIIPDFDSYAVSDRGRVRSICARKGSRALKNDGILGGSLLLHNNRPHRVTVTLRKNNKTYVRSVHRLVLEAFIGPCPIGLEGCHNDGDCTNNHISNLRWDTHSSNIQDAITHGTHYGSKLRWSEIKSSKLTEQDVLYIRSFPLYYGAREMLAQKFGVSRHCIWSILSRKQWRHV